jgi:integrase
VGQGREKAVEEIKMSVYRPTYRDAKTGRKRQSQIWWYHFTFAGRHFQESSKSTRKTVAREAEKPRRAELERALNGVPIEKREDRIRTVSTALQEYEQAYAVNHRKNSLTIVQMRGPHVDRLLGRLLVPDITSEKIIEYMPARQKEGAGNRTINLELLVLSRAIGHTWKALWPKVKRLEENHDAGRALEASEEAALLAAGAANPSKLIYPFLITLVWTGMRSDEARILRWGAEDFGAGQVSVGKAKTEAGTGRPIRTTLRAVLEHHAAWCASNLGPIEPSWYVFPRSNSRRPVDPERAVTSLKTAWNTVRMVAGVSCRLHDLRHSFCTKLAEAGVPERTMLDMMGHMSAAMLRRYSHIRAKARRDAIAAIEARGSDGPAKESAKVGVSEEKAKSVAPYVS